MENLIIISNAVTIGSLLLAIIYTAGVVWRVEKELDIAYKFFLAAVIFLLLAEIVDLYYVVDNSLKIALIVKILRTLFGLGFLAGVLFMRDIARKADGEKK
jgi:hypothetical protein